MRLVSKKLPKKDEEGSLKLIADEGIPFFLPSFPYDAQKRPMHLTFNVSCCPPSQETKDFERQERACKTYSMTYALAICHLCKLSSNPHFHGVAMGKIPRHYCSLLDDAFISANFFHMFSSSFLATFSKIRIVMALKFQETSIF